MQYLKKVDVTVKQEKPATEFSACMPKAAPEELKSNLRAIMESSILLFISSHYALVHSCTITDITNERRGIEGFPQIRVQIKYTPLEVQDAGYSFHRYDTYQKEGDGNEWLVRHGEAQRELSDLMCVPAGEAVEEKFDIFVENEFASDDGKRVSYSIRRE